MLASAVWNARPKSATTVPPELVRVVEQGAVSITAAADIAGQPIDEQREIVAQGEREILRAAIQIRARKAAARRVERHATLIRLSNVDSPLPERRFPIMLADPPYQYDRRWAVSREIENHYPTMTTEAICNCPSQVSPRPTPCCSCGHRHRS